MQTEQTITCPKCGCTYTVYMFSVLPPTCPKCGISKEVDYVTSFEGTGNLSMKRGEQ